MRQPSSFEVCKEGVVLACRLNKALYDLKQAPRAWFHNLEDFLVQDQSFRASQADSSQFFKTTSRGCVFLLVYVDDILAARMKSLIK